MRDTQGKRNKILSTCVSCGFFFSLFYKLQQVKFFVVDHGGEELIWPFLMWYLNIVYAKKAILVLNVPLILLPLSL